MSKCSTEAEFIAVFQRFCADDSLFVVTRTPKPVGASSRLSITLADGKPMLVGAGRVVDSFKGQDNEFKRPGMRLALSDLDPESRETMAKLNAAKQQLGKPGNGIGDKPGAGRSTRATIMAPSVPPPLSRPPIKIPNIPRVGPKVRPEATPVPERIEPQESEAVTGVADPGAPPPPRAAVDDGAVPQPIHDVPPAEAPGAIDDEVTKVSAETEAHKRATTEERAEGSDFILPANPFGELTDANLEAFVECTLYEETGSISLEEAEAEAEARAAAEADDEQTEGDLPPWWPQPGGDGSHTPLPPAAPGMLPPDTTGEVNLRGAPAPQPQQGPPGAPQMMGQPGAPMPGPGAAPRMRAMTPQPMMAGAAPDPNLLTPFPGAIRRRPSWVPMAVTAGITAALTLVIGYVLWGSGSSAPKQGAPAPAPAVAPEKTPEKAPATDTKTEAKPDTAPETAPATDTKTEAAPDEAAATDTAADTATDTEPADDTAPAGDGDTESAEANPTDGEATTAAVPAGACVLTISSNADDAMALVDGKRIGRVPLSKEVPCGAKKLTLEHPRYETRSLALHLQEGESKVSALMHRPIFQLKVLSKPSGAAVTVDGRHVGNTPVSTKVRGYLSLTVKVSKAGYKAYSKRVYAKSKSTTIRARLTR